MEIQNKKLDEGVFMQERQEVLGQWPTGKDVALIIRNGSRRNVSFPRSFWRPRKRGGRSFSRVPACR